MKTTAIIAEYNPFHNGHRYLIGEARRLTGADFILVVMSGDFVQRGAPALYHKYLRTHMALLGGADVVIELPCLYATSSAEFFAQSAVTLLHRLGMIDYLCFGSEQGDISLLSSIASLLIKESEHYQSALLRHLKEGLTFPAARCAALSGLKTGFSLPQEEKLTALLSSPNNILGIEYCKALTTLPSDITPITVKRLGSGYHDETLPSEDQFFGSASAIRKILEDSAKEQELLSVKDQLPENVYKLLIRNGQFADVVTCEDFSAMLHYKLLSEQERGFEHYLDCSRELSNKICRTLPEYDGFASFCRKLKTRELTYTRVSRCLLHILLGITTPKSYLSPFEDRTLSLPYARLLGFRKESQEVLSAMKRSSSVPILSKLADAPELLSEEGQRLLKQDILASEIYEAAAAAKKQREPLNEIRQSPIIV